MATFCVSALPQALCKDFIVPSLCSSLQCCKERVNSPLYKNTEALNHTHPNKSHTDNSEAEIETQFLSNVQITNREGTVICTTLKKSNLMFLEAFDEGKEKKHKINPISSVLPVCQVCFN